MSTTTSTDNSGMSDAELAATIHEVAERQVAAAFESSAVAAEAPVPVPELRHLFADHFDFDPEQGHIVAYDAPRGTKGRLPILANGKPADFNTALAAVMAEDADMAAAMRDRATFGDTFGISRIAAAWANRTATVHTQPGQSNPNDASGQVLAPTSPVASEAPSVTVLRDASLARMTAAIAAGRGPRRIGIFG